MGAEWRREEFASGGKKNNVKCQTPDRPRAVSCVPVPSSHCEGAELRGADVGNFKQKPSSEMFSEKAGNGPLGKGWRVQSVSLEEMGWGDADFAG